MGNLSNKKAGYWQWQDKKFVESEIQGDRELEDHKKKQIFMG